MSSQKRGGKSSGKKTSLPSFGFADDLLKSASSEPLHEEPPQAEGSGLATDPASAKDPASAETGDSNKKSGDGKKVTLPAFGFAEDLLKDVERQRAGVAEVGARSAAAENRIFAFADELDAVAEDRKEAPVRLETWLTFGLAGETYALPVAPVHEVVRPSSITRVPHAPKPIRGVTNLRGRVVPVIDLRLRLELDEAEITRGSRVMVVGSRGRRIGLLVDLVHHVIHLDMDRVQAPPDDVMTVQSDYISGVYHVGEDLILMLDVDRVLIVKDSPPASASPDAPPASLDQGVA